MEISALASGSSGNCFYIEDEGTAVLIDAGISCKQIIEKMLSIKKDPGSIKAIFITHEHSDHIRGADVFARTFKIPIYATKKTAKNCFLCSDESLINNIKNDETVNFNGLGIQAFSKPHLGKDPVSYSAINHKKISVITDSGYASKNITSNVSDSDLLCIESNHDELMLEQGPYPAFLKKWIKGSYGHLSNMQASLCVLEYASSKLKNVVLSHLSQVNNTPEMAFETFRQLIKERRDLSPKVFVSSREMPTPLLKA